MRFQYLIWDFDGTLFDTYPPLKQAIRQAVADFESDVSEERVAALLNVTLRDTIETLAAELGLEVDVFQGRVYHYWGQSTVADSPPIPGAIRVCERFQKAGGRNYIYTHRGRESLNEFLDGYALADLFAGIVARDDGFPRKPDPTGFLALINRYALPKADVLAVGDRDLDIQAAHGAGVAACLYNAEPGEDVRPDFVITDFLELERILGLHG
jgi:phosphoglycolate phosphatase-like HAD superfamily hydrolase